jgi:hypothetical protein
MVNNSTNINKNEHSPLTFTHWTQKKATKFDVGSLDPCLGQAHTYQSNLSQGESYYDLLVYFENKSFNVQDQAHIEQKFKI